MKVLHVIPSVAPRYGGPSTAIIGMCEALNRQPQMTAEVASIDSDGPKRFQIKDWMAPNTKLHLFHESRSLLLQSSRDLERWLSERACDYDIVHAHGMWNTPTYAARRAANKFGKPFVLRPCGMMSKYTWSRKTLMKYGYWLLRERGNVRSAAALHCTSEGEAIDLRNCRPARGEIRVIPHAVDNSAWTTPVKKNELRRLCGPASVGKPLILFLSRLHPKKGIVDFLLPALSRLKTPAFLAIVGGEDDLALGYEAQIRTEITRLGLEKSTALLGPALPEERWAMFDGADLFVLPSHSENFGIVVAEAMARGCPVLVTDGVQSSDIVLQSGSGLVTTTELTGVADGLADMLSSHEARAAMGERGRSYARQHFQWDRVAESLVGLYSLLKSK